MNEYIDSINDTINDSFRDLSEVIDKCNDLTLDKIDELTESIKDLKTEINESNNCLFSIAQALRGA